MVVCNEKENVSLHLSATSFYFSPLRCCCRDEYVPKSRESEARMSNMTRVAGDNTTTTNVHVVQSRQHNSDQPMKQQASAKDNPLTSFQLPSNKQRVLVSFNSGEKKNALSADTIARRLDHAVAAAKPVNRSADLVPLTHAFDKFKRQLKCLIASSKSYHDAMLSMDEARMQVL